ncbi:hypothetical protein Swit_3495 [Rhizorhabdus wittichii RW1]|uniref:Uncharacterized protein n=1 Tax=Rhizorhabdus wittichii (strain DSM 6014 / CCUG 31198 / JCM 15750 / NBRC 105917 / EY 4224 / RW1) TaxID=392499 RepID=A0A9J9HDT8_RHIWR|nr:hypothetical protein Swit_3495 [Rhizorhabdus wittichii RW1]
MFPPSNRNRCGGIRHDPKSASIRRKSRPRADRRNEVSQTRKAGRRCCSSPKSGIPLPQRPPTSCCRRQVQTGCKSPNGLAGLADGSRRIARASSPGQPPEGGHHLAREARVDLRVRKGARSPCAIRRPA